MFRTQTQRARRAASSSSGDSEAGAAASVDSDAAVQNAEQLQELALQHLTFRERSRVVCFPFPTLTHVLPQGTCCMSSLTMALHAMLLCNASSSSRQCWNCIACVRRHCISFIMQDRDMHVQAKMDGDCARCDEARCSWRASHCQSTATHCF